MRVMVIHSRDDYACTGELPFPPIGTIGTIVSGIDEYGEYEVMFDDYPHPSVVVGDPSWITHKSMIVFLGNEKAQVKETKQTIGVE